MDVFSTELARALQQISSKTSHVEQDWKEDKKPTSTWWVQIKLKDGTVGWTKDTGNFSNMDGCG